jgi:hypothetical protein
VNCFFFLSFSFWLFGHFTVIWSMQT